MKQVFIFPIPIGTKPDNFKNTKQLLNPSSVNNNCSTNVLTLFYQSIFLKLHKKTAYLNPCPAEPGYTLPLQTV